MKSGRKAQGLPKSEPHFPPDWDLADIGALQSLENGTAMPHQQQRALKYIVETLAATYDLSYRPGGQDGSRASDFAEGRRFVGLQIVKLLRINPARFKADA